MIQKDKEKKTLEKLDVYRKNQIANQILVNEYMEEAIRAIR